MEEKEVAHPFLSVVSTLSDVCRTAPWLLLLQFTLGRSMFYYYY